MSDNPKHQRFGRVFHARPESEEDRNAALTQELVRDLHQQLMAAIAERDAAREEVEAFKRAISRGVSLFGPGSRYIECTAYLSPHGGWLSPSMDIVLDSELNEMRHQRDAARKEAAWARLADADRVPAGDGGSASLPPSTASLSAAVIAERDAAREALESILSVAGAAFNERVDLDGAIVTISGFCLNGLGRSSPTNEAITTRDDRAPSTASLSAAVAPPKLGER